MTNSAGAIATIALALLLGAMSPGPSFAMVVRASTRTSRHGFVAAIGMGIGALVFGTLALLGLHSLMQHNLFLFTAFRILGSLYLLYLAYRIWREAPEPFSINTRHSRDERGFVSTLLSSLAVQLSNPKTIFVYGSIFASLMPEKPDTTFYLLLLPTVFVVEVSWYAFIAKMISEAARLTLFLSSKKWIERAAAGWIGFLGANVLIGTFAAVARRV